MRVRKKTYFIALTTFIVALLATFIGWTYLQLRQQRKHADIDLYTLVPANCEAIIEVQDLKTLHENITHSCLQRQYKKLDVSVLATFILENLEQLSAIRKTEEMGNTASNLLVSFHKPHTTHDQVVYGMTGSEGHNFMTELLDHYFPNNGTAKSIKYRNEEIHIHPIGRNFLACWAKDGAFAISLQKRLIEKVIDAVKDKKHALTDNTLATLHKQRKRRGTLTMYLHTTSENKWDETDITMNREAIFLTATNDGNGLSYNQPTIAATTENLNTENLPQHIQMIWQTGFNTKTDETPLAKLLDTQECRELTYIMFSPKENKHTRHQILTAYIPVANMDETKISIRYGIGAKRQPSIWTTERAYPVWQYKTMSEEMMKHFAQPLKDTICYLTLCEDKILIAPMRETLRDYIMETEGNKDGNNQTHDHNCNQYLRTLEHLAGESSSTFIADMGDLMCDTLAFNHADNRMLNPFFIKQSTFFRQFIYSIQTLHSNGTTTTNQVLVEKDSLAKKMTEPRR